MSNLVDFTPMVHLQYSSYYPNEIQPLLAPVSLEEHPSLKAPVSTSLEEQGPFSGSLKEQINQFLVSGPLEEHLSSFIPQENSSLPTSFNSHSHPEHFFSAYSTFFRNERRPG